MFNNFYFNPAFAGTDDVTRLTFIHRSQWVGYSPTYGDGGAPTTQFLSGHTPIAKIKGGVDTDWIGYRFRISSDLSLFDILNGEIKWPGTRWTYEIREKRFLQA